MREVRRGTEIRQSKNFFKGSLSLILDIKFHFLISTISSQELYSSVISKKNWGKKEKHRVYTENATSLVCVRILSNLLGSSLRGNVLCTQMLDRFFYLPCRQ